MKKHFFNPFAFVDLDSEPQFAEFVNAGDSLVIILDYDKLKRSIMYGGPLEEHDNYTLRKVFWHWTDRTNPANDLDDFKFPAELHLLFYSTTYGSEGDYRLKSINCLALAFPFKVRILNFLDSGINASF